MKKEFYDFCYEVLSHYLSFPDVADTYKNIKDGLYYRDNYPQNLSDFKMKQKEMVLYIIAVRTNNIIDAYKEKENPLRLIPFSLGRRLDQLSPAELYDELVAEIPRLILKGIHQTIKHFNSTIDDNQLTAELLKEDISILQKCGLV